MASEDGRALELLFAGPMSSDAPKRADELAMERLRPKEREAGVEERPLTDAQKAAIAEARRVYHPGDVIW